MGFAGFAGQPERRAVAGAERGAGGAWRAGEVAACDVADREALAALIASVPAEHPLTAVVHAAGVVDDATIEALTDAHIDDVMRSKVTAAWHLHELTAELPLTAFVLYSSIAGTLGTLGQGNYAAANVFLDALAEHRQASGLPATAMAWGFWADRSGATGHLSDGDVARMARSGIAPMTSDEGLALFDAVAVFGFCDDGSGAARRRRVAGSLGGRPGTAAVAPARWSGRRGAAHGCGFGAVGGCLDLVGVLGSLGGERARPSGRGALRGRCAAAAHGPGAVPRGGGAEP